MAHTCQQCGATIEDSTPFCRQCRAPQIRVAVAGPESALSSPSALPEESGSLPRSPSVHVVAPVNIQWRHAFRAAATAGFIGASLMLTPLGALGLGMLAAGVLAVALHRRNSAGYALRPGQGAKVGALSGALGFAFFSIFLAIQVAVLHRGDELRSALVHAVEQAAARSSDPQAHAMAAWLTSPEGLGLMVVLSLFFTLVMFVILAALGGTLAAALGRRNSKG